jgi:hypothetical protein
MVLTLYRLIKLIQHSRDPQLIGGLVAKIRRHSSQVTLNFLLEVTTVLIRFSMQVSEIERPM